MFVFCFSRHLEPTTYSKLFPSSFYSQAKHSSTATMTEGSIDQSCSFGWTVYKQQPDNIRSSTGSRGQLCTGWGCLIDRTSVGIHYGDSCTGRMLCTTRTISYVMCDLTSISEVITPHLSRYRFVPHWLYNSPSYEVIDTSEYDFSDRMCCRPS